MSPDEVRPDDVRPTAVVDIDGVLADVGHRLHHLDRRPKNWVGFFAAMDADPAHPEGLALARELATAHDIVYLSGRPERTRRVTQNWLSAHDLPPGRIYLRPDDDRRPARLFKLGMLRRFAAEGPVAILVDDDPQVCATVRQAGFAVFEATWNRPDDELLDAQEREGRT